MAKHNRFKSNYASTKYKESSSLKIRNESRNKMFAFWAVFIVILGILLVIALVLILIFI